MKGRNNLYENAFLFILSDFEGIRWIEFFKRAQFILNAYFEATCTPRNTDQYLANFKAVGPVQSQRKTALL